MDERFAKLEQDIQEIKSRNKRVEADKAWETSWFRTIALTVITYVIAMLVLLLIDVEEYWLGALIPAVGFFLSVQSLPILKKWWLKKNDR